MNMILVTNTGKQLYNQYTMDVMMLHPIVKRQKPTSSVMEELVLMTTCISSALPRKTSAALELTLLL